MQFTFFDSQNKKLSEFLGYECPYHENLINFMQFKNFRENALFLTFKLSAEGQIKEGSNWFGHS